MLLYYCLYWAVVLVLMYWKWRHGTLTDERLAAMPSVRAHSDGEAGGERGRSAAGRCHQQQQ